MSDDPTPGPLNRLSRPVFALLVVLVFLGTLLLAKLWMDRQEARSEEEATREACEMMNDAFAIDTDC